MGLFGGKHPDITPGFLTGAIVGFAPVLMKLTAAFGIWSPSAAQQGAITDALSWAVPLGIALILGDTGLRAARNAKEARVQSAAIVAQPTVSELDASDDDLPDDETELASPPPQSAIRPDAP